MLFKASPIVARLSRIPIHAAYKENIESCINVYIHCVEHIFIVPEVFAHFIKKWYHYYQYMYAHRANHFSQKQVSSPSQANSTISAKPASISTPPAKRSRIRSSFRKAPARAILNRALSLLTVVT